MDASIKVKPRMRPATWDKHLEEGTRWFCWCPRAIGFGGTWEEAYADWQKVRK